MDTGYKVLVIDDEPFIRSLFETVLSENDCMVATCGSGREGVEVAGKGSFDLVITDINMPDLGGIDVLRSIKNQNPDIGVIVITGYASLETAMEALHLGADEYLKKPFEVKDGHIPIPEGPGLGIELDDDALAGKLGHDWKSPETYLDSDASVVDW